MDPKSAVQDLDQRVPCVWWAPGPAPGQGTSAATASPQTVMDSMPTARGRSTPAVLIGIGNSNTYAHLLDGDCPCGRGAQHRTCTDPTYSGKRSGRPKRGLLSTPRAGKAVSVMALPVQRRGAGGLRGAVGQCRVAARQSAPWFMRMGVGV